MQDFQPNSPRVTVLLYADDLVIFADTQAELQRALDAVASWGAKWRFAFGAGEDKSAVMVVNPGRSLPTPFHLGELHLPFVERYKHLGIVIDSHGRWHPHIDHLAQRGERRFAQCVAWALREGLDLVWASHLFNTYVSSAAQYGLEFAGMDPAAIRHLDARLRRWGRRLLQWPAGSPSAAVLGELGWQDAWSLLLKRSAGLAAKLQCLIATVPRASAPAMLLHAQTLGHHGLPGSSVQPVCPTQLSGGSAPAHLGMCAIDGCDRLSFHISAPSPLDATVTRLVLWPVCRSTPSCSPCRTCMFVYMEAV